MGYIDAQAPSAQAFADDYFRAVGSIPQGSSGASLARAQAAAEALGFAASNDLSNADISALRAAMLEGWNSLSEDEQAAFDANFMSLVSMIDDARADWEANKGPFNDAGVEDEMEAFLADEMTMSSWDILLSSTLTMGNSTNA